MDPDARTRAWLRVSRVAVAQGGMLGLDQLTAHGLDEGEVKRADTNARLIPVHIGVRALAYRRDDLDARHWAAVLGKGEGIRLSHRSAIERLGLLTPIAGPVHVSVRRHQRFQRANVVIHRPTDDAPRHTAHVNGLPTSAPARALVELASCAPDPVVTRATHEALIRQLVTVEAVLVELEPCGRRRGARKLRRALGRPAVDLRSRYERAVLRLCEHPAIPVAAVNQLLAVSWGTIRPDFCWPDLRLIVEVDGDFVHGTPHAVAADKRRDRRLRAEGWIVERFPGDDALTKPEAVQEELIAIIARARRRHFRLSAPKMSPP